MVAEAEAFDREGAEAELAASLEELRPAVHVDALAVDEVEAQRVELPARHLDAETGAVGRVFSVKKTDCQRSCRRSSVSSPSTQIVGRRVSQSAIPRLNPETV